SLAMVGFVAVCETVLQPPLMRSSVAESRFSSLRVIGGLLVEVTPRWRAASARRTTLRLQSHPARVCNGHVYQNAAITPTTIAMTATTSPGIHSRRNANGSGSIGGNCIVTCPNGTVGTFDGTSTWTCVGGSGVGRGVKRDGVAARGFVSSNVAGPACA